MGASRRTALMVSGALCGALALGAAGTAGASAGFPPPKPPTSPAAAKAPVPSPESLREAASGGARAIDRNVVGQRAAAALKACRASGLAAEAAGDAQRGPSCTQVEEHLGGLNRARAALAEEAVAAHPDLERMTTAATDAAAATAHLAKDGVDVSRRGPAPGHGHERYDGGGPGLLALVQNLLGGLVHALGGVVGGLTGLIGGVLGGILG
ncbi:hypothetical protein [Streptomyces roseoverticillatus]|uniref:Uncharacterized protein n=1 Tax=Streptomyces roseoverticillatus TaxID=66429 RepID=A0ABV3J5C4_9ACTN